MPFFKQLLVLTIAMLFLPLHAMDKTSAPASNQVYVKILAHTGAEGGTTIAFPHEMVQQIEFLKDMAESLPGSGTEEQPFVISGNVTPEEFSMVINLFSIQPVPSLQEAIWRHFAKDNNRYATFAQIIKVSDFLGLNPIIIDAIKECIIKPPREKKIPSAATTATSSTSTSMLSAETLDDALHAQLPTLNTLNLETLLPIKEELLKSIGMQTIENTNNPEKKHPEEKEKINVQPNLTIRYVKYFNHSTDFIAQTWDPNVNDGSITIFSSSNNPKIIQLEQFATMANVPNQDMLPTIIGETGANPNHIPCPDIGDHMKVAISKDDQYRAISLFHTIAFEGHDENAEPTPVTIGMSHIYQGNTLIATIPDLIIFIDNYKDKTGAEKIICITGNDDRNDRIIEIDPQSATISLITQFDTDEIMAEYLAGSLLLCSRYNDPVPPLLIINLFTHQSIVIESNATSFYNGISAAMINSTTLQIDGIVNDDAGHYIDTYQINMEQHIPVKETKRKLYNYTFKATLCDFLPSKILIINTDHPTLRGIKNLNIIAKSDGIYVVYFNNATTETRLFKWLDKNKSNALLQQLDSFTHLSIEQLYAIEEIVYRLTHGTFTTMTPTEQKLFGSMALDDQLFFQQLFKEQFNITILLPESPSVESAQSGGIKRAAKTSKNPRRTKRRKLEQGTAEGSDKDESSEEAPDKSEEPPQ